jgi:hypothetical protein
VPKNTMIFLNVFPKLNNNNHTKYTAPNDPCPISRKSLNLSSGSFVEKSDATEGSLRLPGFNIA